MSTKDERFLIEIYTQIQSAEKPKQGVDPQLIGKKMGFSPKQVESILRWLFQANFLKKIGEDRVILTPHGETITKELLKDGRSS